MYLLFALLLAQPESIRVELKGAEHVDVEVRLLQGAMTRRVVSVPKGTRTCTLGGLRPGRYDVWARAPGWASALARGLPTAPASAKGADAVLHLRPVVAVPIRAPEGATVLARGLRFAPAMLKLPPGLHAVVVQHPERLSSDCSTRCSR